MSKGLDRHLVGNKTKLAGVLCYAAILPFQPLFPPIVFGLCLFWLGYLIAFSQKELVAGFKNPIFWLFAGLYILQVTGVFYSTNVDEGWRDVVLKISLFLWPAGLVSTKSFTQKEKTSIVFVFIGALALSNLSNLYLSFLSYLDTGVIQELMYHNLSHWDMIPNHYMSMYTSFAILSLLVLLVKNWRDWKSSRKMISGFLILFLLIIQALFSVRIQMIALPISLFLVVFIMMKGRFSSKKLMVGSIVGVVVFCSALWLVPGSNRRIMETVDELRSVDGMVNDRQTNHRVFLWKYGQDVISENWLAGVGTGAADNALHDKLVNCKEPFFKDRVVYFLYEKKYNYHSVFLQHWAANGVIAFVILLSLIVIAFVKSIKTKDFIGLSFILVFVFSGLTESLLERQAGVYFFGFFYALLFLQQTKLKDTTEKE